MGRTEALALLQQMSNGYWGTQILSVAATLGIADLLADGPQGVEALAAATDTHAPSLHRLMRALSGLGVVKEIKSGVYETTPLGECLGSGSPDALRARAILNGGLWYTAWGGLLHSVRTGQTAFDHMTGKTFFEYLAADGEATDVFNEAMASSTEGAASAVARTYDFSGARTIVDVGGGTGMFLAGILRANPQAQGVLLERPDAATTADELLGSVGMRQRCNVVAGNFFTAVPAGGDVYILSWVLHDWDDERSIAILGNCRQAMTPDARLLVIEQVIPPGNEPSLSKLYDLHMLVLSGGRERCEDEYRDLLAAAGLDLVRIIPTDVPRSIIEARVRSSPGTN
jgi:O-methyltransferase domain/Dimerisation domain